MNPWMLSESKKIDPSLIEEFTEQTGISLPDYTDPTFIRLVFDYLSSKDWNWFLSKQKDNYVMTIDVSGQESIVFHTSLPCAIFLCALDALCCENVQ